MDTSAISIQSVDRQGATRAESSKPIFRFEGGDAIIHLSRNNHDTLILPSSRLITQSEWFGASLKWRKPLSQLDASVPIRRYGLVFDVSMRRLTLQSMEKRLENDDKFFSLPRQHAILGPSSCGPIPRRTDLVFSVQNARWLCVQVHKILFSLLLGQPCMEHLIERGWPLGSNHIFALAEYHQLFPALTSKVEALFRASQNLRKHIMLYPSHYLVLSETLRSRLLYEEAMRHFVGRFDSAYFNSNHRFLSEKTKLLAYKKHTELVRDLSKLSFLIEGRYTLNNLPTPAFPVPNQDLTMREEIRFLARAVWCEWLAINGPNPQDRCQWGGASWIHDLMWTRTRREDWWY